MENTQAATKPTKRKTAAKAVKSIVAILLMVAIAFAAALIVHKTDRAVPASAQTGGLSAYELAVQNGYTGDLEQWLMSLAGETGPEWLYRQYRRMARFFDRCARQNGGNRFRRQISI